MDDLNPFSGIKEYLNNLVEATLNGGLKAKVLMVTAALFMVGFYYSLLLLLGEIVEVMDLPTRTGVLPSTIENLVLAFLFWAGHKYLYTKAKEEL